MVLSFFGTDFTANRLSYNHLKTKSYAASRFSTDLSLRHRTSSRLRRLDGHSRGNFSRTEGILPKCLRHDEVSGEAEILLPLHLRVLFQPLHQFNISRHHAVQNALRRLARLPAGIFCTGLGRQLVYESLRLPAPKPESREDRSQHQRHRPQRTGKRKVMI